MKNSFSNIVGSINNTLDRASTIVISQATAAHTQSADLGSSNEGLSRQTLNVTHLINNTLTSVANLTSVPLGSVLNLTGGSADLAAGGHLINVAKHQLIKLDGIVNNTLSNIASLTSHIGQTVGNSAKIGVSGSLNASI